MELTQSSGAHNMMGFMVAAGIFAVGVAVLCVTVEIRSDRQDARQNIVLDRQEAVLKQLKEERQMLEEQYAATLIARQQFAQQQKVADQQREAMAVQQREMIRLLIRAAPACGTKAGE